jgi:hypothetical protein
VPRADLPYESALPNISHCTINPHDFAIAAAIGSNLSCCEIQQFGLPD